MEASELIAILWILFALGITLGFTALIKRRISKRREIEFDELLKKIEDANKLDSSDDKPAD
jgi:hypothetical protein